MSLSDSLKNQLYTYFIKAGMYDYKRGWLKGDCPFCGKHDKFGVNLYLNRTNCFVCGNHGTPMNTILQVSGAQTYREALSLLNTEELFKYTDPEMDFLEENPIELPQGFVRLKYGDSIVGDAICKYVEGRGFSVSTLAKKGFGYCEDGDLFGYLIMPFYVNNKLAYYHARNVYGNGPKFKNPEISDVGIGKSLLLYNIDALWMYKTIFLVESVLNAETLGDKALATGGKKVSDYQLNLFLRSPVENIVVLLDPDGWDDALKIGFKLVYEKNIKLCRLPEETDVNSLGRKRTINIIYKNRYLTHSDILRLKTEYDHETGPITSH